MDPETVTGTERGRQPDHNHDPVYFTGLDIHFARRQYGPVAPKIKPPRYRRAVTATPGALAAVTLTWKTPTVTNGARCHLVCRDGTRRRGRQEDRLLSVSRSHPVDHRPHQRHPVYVQGRGRKRRGHWSGLSGVGCDQGRDATRAHSRARNRRPRPGHGVVDPASKSNGAAAREWPTSSRPMSGASAKSAHTFNATMTTETITGLTNGTTYTFKVAAKNSLGTGPQSAPSPAVKPT